LCCKAKNASKDKIYISYLILFFFTAACSDRSGERNCKSWQQKYNFCNRSDAGRYCEKTCGKCTSGGGSGGSCGVSKVPQSRVVNGVDAKPGAWPWIASLQYYNGHFCGATLLNTKWVINFII